jgi:hypothetical protein
VPERSMIPGRMIDLRIIKRTSSESSDDDEMPRRERPCRGMNLGQSPGVVQDLWPIPVC